MWLRKEFCSNSDHETHSNGKTYFFVTVKELSCRSSGYNSPLGQRSTNFPQIWQKPQNFVPEGWHEARFCWGSKNFRRHFKSLVAWASQRPGFFHPDLGQHFISIRGDTPAELADILPKHAGNVTTREHEWVPPTHNLKLAYFAKFWS